MPDAVPIAATTRPVVLIGGATGHSRSPALHNPAFARLGLDLVYLAADVPPERLPDAVAGLRGLGFAGANVTIPHKETVLPLLDALSDDARALGAVNTITNDGGGGRLVGHNTDVGGFLDGLGMHAEQLRGAEMLVWGGGGAARAVVYALLGLEPSRLTVAARRREQARALTDALARFDPAQALRIASPDEAAPERSGLLVNATPLGMAGRFEEATPWPEARFRAGQVVYDLVYAPARTHLLREAEAAGAAVIGGMPMLRGQAARAFELWTGRAFPSDP